MKKFYSVILIAMLSILSGFNDITINNKYEENGAEEVKETMSSTIFVDPSIDQSTNKMVSIIVEFKTRPAKIAVLEAKAQGIELSIEEAKQKVEESHEMFQKELQTLLAQNQVKYTIKHTYTSALNGVSMELPANEIKRLLESSVIGRITQNKEIHIDPPITPHF